MLLNEEQIEIAARKLCELRSLDPNGSAKSPPNNEGLDVCTFTTNLQSAKNEIREANRVQVAIAFGYSNGASQSQETQVQTIESNEANIDEMNDIGIVLDDGRQLTYHELGSILMQLSKDFRQLRFTENVRGSIGELRGRLSDAGQILLGVDSE